MLVLQCELLREVVLLRQNAIPLCLYTQCIAGEQITHRTANEIESPRAERHGQRSRGVRDQRAQLHQLFGNRGLALRKPVGHVPQVALSVIKLLLSLE